ncbi:calcium-binding protein, partial [Jannaschia seohaensis]
TDSAAPYTTDILSLDDGQVSLQKAVTVTDGGATWEGDTAAAAASVDLGGNFIVGDDGPLIQATTDLVFANSDKSGTGVFQYNIGADQWTAPYTAIRSDFLSVALSGTVGAAAISDVSVQWSSEDATSAEFDFSFDYVFNPTTGDTNTATGTITFDKAAGTYTVTLNDTLSGYSIVNTAGTISKDEYNLEGSAASQPEVIVSKLSEDFWIQFRGDQETNSVDITAGGDATWTAGELFSASQTYVTASQTQNGVAGDTIQNDEILDLNFYLDNPALSRPGYPFPPDNPIDDPKAEFGPDGRADGIYAYFDGVGDEDFLFLLKLIDSDGIVISRVVVVESTDIVRNTNQFDETLLPTNLGLTGMLDNNDGVVVIESNDYNLAGEDYQIYGMQILTAANSFSGTGIDLNPVTGEEAGASTGSQAFPSSTSPDNDVAKIVDIGFVLQNDFQNNADLALAVALNDADHDVTPTQTLNIDVVSNGVLEGGANADSINGTDGDDTLIGNGGADILTGELGGDEFVFNDPGEGPDVLPDFDGTEGDQLVLAQSGFSALSVGTLAADAFVSGATVDADSASDGNDHLLYNSLSGDLFYDADGSSGGAILIASLTDGITAATLTADDILVIA